VPPLAATPLVPSVRRNPECTCRERCPCQSGLRQTDGDGTSFVGRTNQLSGLLLSRNCSNLLASHGGSKTARDVMRLWDPTPRLGRKNRRAQTISATTNVGGESNESKIPTSVFREAHEALPAFHVGRCPILSPAKVVPGNRVGISRNFGLGFQIGEPTAITAKAFVGEPRL